MFYLSTANVFTINILSRTAPNHELLISNSSHFCSLVTVILTWCNRSISIITYKCLQLQLFRCLLWMIRNMSVTMLLSRHLQHLPSPLQSRLFSISSAQLAKRWREKNTASFQSELRNPVAEVEPPQVGVAAENGTPYDNKPFKLRVEKYHEYVWCGCGWARTSQPLCDGACECWMNRKIVKVRYF